ncbi:hypothetical protein EON81_29865 [bacterium]|nr:MAG: hypothetical protein EON81_29865 [bacterium]
MKLEERAQIAWAVLSYAASHRQTLEYITLAKLTGMAPSGIGGLLDCIHIYCQRNDLPALSVLVVQRGTGQPGVGFTATENVLAETAKVFAYPWIDSELPSSDALRRSELTLESLTPTRQRLVRHLRTHPGQSAKEIAELLYPNAPYQQQVNGELNALISLGFAHREESGGRYRYWTEANE